MWPFRRRGRPDPEALFAELARAHPGKARYTDLDRYREFRKVFLGSEEGKRVLHEILSWGHMFRPSVPTGAIDPYRTHFAEGERNIALKLLTAINAEPSERPKETRRKP